MSIHQMLTKIKNTVTVQPKQATTTSSLWFGYIWTVDVFLLLLFDMLKHKWVRVT